VLDHLILFLIYVIEDIYKELKSKQSEVDICIETTFVVFYHILQKSPKITFIDIIQIPVLINPKLARSEYFKIMAANRRTSSTPESRY
jgi:hypothetical protein